MAILHAHIYNIVPPAFDILTPSELSSKTSSWGCKGCMYVMASTGHFQIDLTAHSTSLVEYERPEGDEKREIAKLEILSRSTNI